IMYDQAYAQKTTSQTDIFRANQDPAQDDPYMTQESAVEYTYDLRNNIVRLIKTAESSSSYDPADDSKKGAETITTDYTYNTCGNLTAVSGSGSGGGYKYDETQRLWLETDDYDITVSYEVKLGKAELIEKTIKDKKEGADEE
ncbi:MAG: hypothetical protein PHT59_04105, partial [Candidatus Omnitrophica bacterium]|nr:hypothetical protein [Candidatus Omnitrophota bacterium]